ncbi:ATP-binding protein [Bailinhaonella thermotolerans]|uniref:ATP-binding protein n=1 Tax=Bailinhaonella thermotolerans TaxID=1070861 RepID=A0A3A4AX95_9ACTN|nr:ATP-binding protein [Bailinhaonella thermotolerans]RJL35272.1 ATP-binding protein [Bailinhaonella thermotolerans]
MDPEGRFDELVRERTGPDFVEREWLYEAVERAGAQYVLVTGEPGAGKTSLMAGLARRRPGWLRYFVRRDSLSRPEETGLTAFLLTIGHQLARRRPELFEPARLELLVRQRIGPVEPGGRVVGVQVEHLSISPFHATAVLRVEQDVGANAGTVIGVAARSMSVDPRVERPEILAHLGLIDPALLLLEDDPGERIVLLVDGVDELARSPGGGELLDWLTAGPDLPSNVRVILTSREHEALERLRLGRPGRVAEIRIDPAARQVADDLAAYARRTLMTPRILGLARDHGHEPGDLVRGLVRRAAGNFQYLAAWRRGLGDALDRGDAATAGRLLRFADLPAGLDALYGVFMTSVRADLERMGRLAPGGPGSPGPRAWHDVGRPLLGVLTVAREPLPAGRLIALAGVTTSREAAGDVLRRLRWLLDARDGRVSLFHGSLAEYLARGDPADPAGPSWAVDVPHWHGRIARHYRGTAATWDQVDWAAVDRYGLAHLAWHVIGSGDGDPVELVCPGLRQAIRAAFGTDRHLLRVAEAAVAHVIDRRPGAAALPDLLFLGVVRRRLLRSALTLAPQVLALMTRLGREAQALELLRALPPSEQRFEGLRAALPYLPEGQAGEKILELLVETALVTGKPAHYYTAARLLAPRDLDRAVRLWERGRARDRDHRAPRAPCAVYRAAAEAADPARALAHIARMESGRCAAYLDLAGRLPPGQVPDPLTRAEHCLPSAPPAERVGARGRLAALWRAHDPERARGHAHAALAEARDRLAGAPGDPGAGDRVVEELAAGMAEAADALAPHFREQARALTGLLEGLRVSGLWDDAQIRAVALLLDWGEHDRAHALIARILAWNDTLWTTSKIAKVLAGHDPGLARRLMERASARSGAPSPLDGLIGRLFGDGDRRTMALHLAAGEPDRAEREARRIRALTWSPATHDRYSTLAEIAHIQLDLGREDRARALLEEALRHAETPPPLADEEGSPPFRPAEPGRPAVRADRRDQLMDLGYVFNVDQGWQARRRTRLFTDPADVVRAVLPGPASLGHPYGLARTLRILAEAIAPADHDQALATVRALTDQGEAAIGYAALVADAGRRGDRAREDERRRDLEEAVARIVPYTWIGDSQDDRALAYLRPDHRARFETATRIMPWDADAGLRLIQRTGAPYLMYAYRFSFGCWASAAHTTDVCQGRPAHPAFAAMHAMILRRPPEQAGHDPLILAVAMARAANNERLIRAFAPGAAAPGPPAPGSAAPGSGTAGFRTPGFRTAGSGTAGSGAAGDVPMEDVPDEVCAALASLVPPGAGAALGPGFPGRVRALLDGPRLPAAAALCAYAAAVLPAGDPALRDLCRQVLDAARQAPGTAAIAVRLSLAASPPLADLVDVPALAGEILALPEGLGDEYGELRRALFPILLERDPPAALRLLSGAFDESWAMAMAMLESVPAATARALGPGAATTLREAVARGLRCTQPPGSPPPAETDGVRLPPP